MKKTRAVLILISLFSSGCAMMLHGTSQPIQFTSTPSGASVEFRELTCITPCTLDVPRSTRPAMLRVNLAGHEGYTGEIVSHPLETGEAGGLLIIPALFDALLIVPGLIDIGMDTFVEWPKAIHATLPLEKQGSAKLEVKRGKVN